MRTILTILAIAGVVVTGTMVSPAVVTAQESDTQTITSCTTITEPGVYALGNDITNTSADSCIQIESGDVVLDGEGHSLTGDGDGVAVDVTAHEERNQDPYVNVTVRDLQVESWGTGLEFVNTRNATASDVTVTDADIGVRAGSSTAHLPGYDATAHGTTVVDSTVRDVGYGVVGEISNDVEVVDNTVAEYDDVGVRLDVVSNSSFSGNEIVGSNESRDAAIRLGATEDPYDDGSHDNVIESNRIVDSIVDVDLERDSVTRNRVVRNDVTRGGIHVSGSRGPATRTVVAGNELTDSSIDVVLASGVTVEENVLTNPGAAPDESIRLNDAGPVTVRNNSITGASTGILIEHLSKENTVVDNTVTDSDVGVTIQEDSVNNTVEGNTIANNGNGVEISLVDSYEDGTNYVRGNDIVDNENGVFVEATDQPLVVESNQISDNENGIKVQASAVCSAGAEGAELLSVHGNTLADNAAYGVLNENGDVLNATGNFWGASDGPSSADDADAPFEDPVTGELANGSGTAVSEDPNAAGQSNVHFDSWLQQPPEDAGAGNESAS
ncbi:right-handed parallel beta-helix repeat-containing protein [Halorarum halophilum]|uniref:Right-handed parallel beta-helix repeat-containing protein n=1 Tax=Halorarum halophilum TaxID=2743090 RepID=A0A7D5KM77_9EURY|nr:NosD domain-containing protein [Halobaculum halophilum]QLG27482.1 right-handed parallel beta-helix repeat-containing protein [Halobaculum halophilum]